MKQPLSSVRGTDSRPSAQCRTTIGMVTLTGAPTGETKAEMRASFSGDESGVAFVEFALILPLMLMLFLGLVEVSRGIEVAHTIDRVAHTVADLTGQTLDGGDNDGQAGVSDPDFRDLINAAHSMIAPLPGLPMDIVFSEVKIASTASGGYKALVQWSFNREGKANTRPCHTVLGLSNDSSLSHIAPELVNDANSISYIIVVDVSYTYSPGFSFKLFDWSSPPTWTLRSTAYAPVRNTYDPPHIQYKASTSFGEDCTASSD